MAPEIQPVGAGHRFRISSGSGSEMRQAVGVAVFFYMIVRNLADGRRDKRSAPAG